MRAKRRIAVVTGGRPDYGLFSPLLRLLAADEGVELQLIVTGMHLLPEQGNSCQQIERDGYAIAAKVDLKLSLDTPSAISNAVAVGISGMAEAFQALKPDVVVLLGDRFESLAAATAAMLARLPIAHIHGGEATEGLIDEPIRHSITKMAHLHFTSTEAYRRRVIQLGEDPARVHCVGAIGLDNIKSLHLLDRPALERELGWQLGHPTFVVTYHPVTLEAGSSQFYGKELITALDRFPDASIIITLPNADTDSAALRAQLQAYADRNKPRVLAFAILGTLRYLSLLRECDVVVGNSSSGLIEVPSFAVPTVNIGDRQRGRIAPPSVVQAEADHASIVAAIHKALDPAFRASLRAVRNPYGDGTAAPKIARVLTTAPLGEALIKKRFYDLPLEIPA